MAVAGRGAGSKKVFYLYNNTKVSGGDNVLWKIIEMKETECSRARDRERQGERKLVDWCPWTQEGIISRTQAEYLSAWPISTKLCFIDFLINFV